MSKNVTEAKNMSTSWYSVDMLHLTLEFNEALCRNVSWPFMVVARQPAETPEERFKCVNPLISQKEANGHISQNVKLLLLLTVR